MEKTKLTASKLIITILITTLYYEFWWDQTFNALRRAWISGFQMTAAVDIVVLILEYCFYLRPVWNHLFDDWPEYCTHFCMI